MNKALRTFFLILIVILATLWGAIVKAPDRQLTISFLDVGQGDAIFIETAGSQQILIDGGPDKSVLEELPIPFYDHSIDAIFLTHPHADHLVGLIEVIKRYQVSIVYITGVVHDTAVYIEFLNIIKEKNIPTVAVKGGDEIDFGETKFKVFWPESGLSGQSVDNLNDTSLVLGIEDGDFRALMLGDLEKENQQKMLTGGRLAESYQIIKIAHHGSSDGFLPELFDKLKPKKAVICVGADNQYGHPTASTIEQLQNRNIKILRTDRDGTIKITP